MIFFVFLALGFLTYSLFSLHHKIKSLELEVECNHRMAASDSFVAEQMARIQTRIGFLEKSCEWDRDWLAKNFQPPDASDVPAYRIYTPYKAPENKRHPLEGDAHKIGNNLHPMFPTSYARTYSLSTPHLSDILLPPTPMTNKYGEAFCKGGKWDMNKSAASNWNSQGIPGVDGEPNPSIPDGISLGSIEYPTSHAECPEDINPESIETVEMEFAGYEEYRCSVCGKERIKAPNHEYHNASGQLVCPDCFFEEES